MIERVMLAVTILGVATMILIVIGSIAYGEVTKQCRDLSIKKQAEYYDEMHGKGNFTSPEFRASKYADECVKSNWIVIDWPQIDLNPIKVREP